MPNWLGDVVMATPILADLKHNFPKSSITAMCETKVAPLLEKDPHIDELFSYQRPSGWIHRRQHLNIIESLRKGDFDLGILLTNSLSSAWWFWRGHIKERVGFSTNLRSPLLTKAVPFPNNKENCHQTLTYKTLLEPLGIPKTNSQAELFLSTDEINGAKELLARLGITWGKDKIVGINPGAAYGSAKCWLPDRFVAVGKELLKDPSVKVIFFGDKNGFDLVSQITKELPSAINLAGKTSIRELMALLKCTSLLLTNDSGPMHIAAALGTPLLALFGSTSAIKTGPLPKGEVICKNVECSPCYRRTCPIDFRCMTRISSEEVAERLKKMLGSP